MRRALLTATLCLAVGTATAQTTLTGRVADEREPVRFATAALLRDGRQQAAATTDAEGRFMLRADTGSYLLSLRHVAYRPIDTLIRIGAQGVELGDLKMEPANIRTVTVTADAVTRESDRYVVRVGDGPQLAGRDATELLALAPGVWIGDEGISVNGAGGTQVYVDGRQLKGSAEETASYLRSLTAADIARIEVLPQAGADYAADARGGVILITLRRRRDNGIDGSLQAATIQSSRLHAYAPSGRIGIRTGRWTIDASASGNLTPRADSRYEESRSYTAPHAPFAAETRTGSRMESGRGRLAVFYDPDRRQSVGLAAEYTGRSMRMPTEARTASGDEEILNRYRQRTDNSTFTLTANYTFRLDTAGSRIRLIADYTRYGTDGANDYRASVTAPGCARDSVYRSASASHYDLVTADASLTLRLPHAWTLRTGLRYTRNEMDDRSAYEAQQTGSFQIETAPGGAWQHLPEYGYAQHCTEQIGALYASLGFARGRWECSAGVRGEYTSVRSRSLIRDYFSLFPHLSVSRSLNALRTWMLVAQWSRNIERPAFASLNPARLQLSEYSYQTGNPALRPTYINRFSLTAVWRYRFTLTVGGNLHRDLIREVAHTDRTDPDVVFIRPENHYAEDHWFAAVSLPFRPARRFNLTLNAVGVAQRIRFSRTDPVRTHYLLFADATAALTLPAGFYFEAVYRVQSRLYSGNSEVGPRHLLSATLKKQLCRKRLTLYCTAQNLTNCGVEYVSSTGGMRRTLRGAQGWSDRAWKIGATWTFRSGKEFRARKVESAADRDRKRLQTPEQ